MSYLTIGSGKAARNFNRYLRHLSLPLETWNRQCFDKSNLTEKSKDASHVLLLIPEGAISHFVAAHACLSSKTLVHFSGTFASPKVHATYPITVFDGITGDQDAYRSIPFVVDDTGPSFEQLLPGIPNRSFRLSKEQRIHLDCMSTMATSLSTLAWTKLFQSMVERCGIPQECGFQLVEKVTKLLCAAGDSPAIGRLPPSDPMIGTLSNANAYKVKAHLSALRHDKLCGVYREFAKLCLPVKKRLTVPQIRSLKGKRRISMTVLYDCPTAQIADESDIDIVVVGDSVAMNFYGHENTVATTVDIMEAHTKAVAAGLQNTFLVADLPFLSYQGGIDATMDAVRRLISAGAEAVKLEGGSPHCIETTKLLVDAGVPVMGHLGLTPQHLHNLGGHRVQGRSSEMADTMVKAAEGLEKAGAFSVVLECVPVGLAERMTKAVKIPVISIGAGDKTDGQVLLFTDVIGLTSKLKPKFVKSYMPAFDNARSALDSFVDEIHQGTFPTEKNWYK